MAPTIRGLSRYFQVKKVAAMKFGAPELGHVVLGIPELPAKQKIGKASLFSGFSKNGCLWALAVFDGSRWNLDTDFGRVL